MLAASGMIGESGGDWTRTFFVDFFGRSVCWKDAYSVGELVW